ncbi:Ig-like domain-containing protein [Aquabacterium sp.]|uniref:Ig-like domain-containing protein n=1 Tax=Aquabacterium sp. TaxID=1872578 RepID=UPI002C5856A3|nr:Ig-like domain-containing protein [Aquabacterium sp.]HSW04225.1 Ig-like domain-containing protein [Aquabacterium sp.]
MNRSIRFDRWLGWLATLAIAGGLAACGGGLYIAVGDDGYDDPPQVNLVASSSSASPGQGVRLAAAASDDYGVQRVQFFRIEPDGAATALGSDGVAPFEWDTTLPATTANEVRYFARAFDDAGQATDSASIAVTVQR